ncbi:hypothetical protein EV655_10238 [Rhodovulum euryhalinum]|uniref:Uncharacterized protein n=1 Tax=Rhodovulum euryhalinum TaxID=35805 RepID=A0A4R2KJ57_9RHOB|nr:hypothetical protein EV655_10238 [Rhodovulum euryhalinum]
MHARAAQARGGGLIRLRASCGGRRPGPAGDVVTPAGRPGVSFVR